MKPPSELACDLCRCNSYSGHVNTYKVWTLCGCGHEMSQHNTVARRRRPAVSMRDCVERLLGDVWVAVAPDIFAGNGNQELSAADVRGIVADKFEANVSDADVVQWWYGQAADTRADMLRAVFPPGRYTL